MGSVLKPMKWNQGIPSLKVVNLVFNVHHNDSRRCKIPFVCLPVPGAYCLIVCSMMSCRWYCRVVIDIVVSSLSNEVGGLLLIKAWLSLNTIDDVEDRVKFSQLCICEKQIGPHQVEQELAEHLIFLLFFLNSSVSILDRFFRNLPHWFTGEVGNQSESRHVKSAHVLEICGIANLSISEHRIIPFFNHAHNEVTLT